MNFTARFTTKLTLDRLAKRVLPRVPAGDFFSPLERRTVAAAAEVLLEGCPVEITPGQVVQKIEEFLLLGRSQRAWRIRFLVLGVEFTPLVLREGGRFSHLTPPQRRDLMERKFIHGRHVWAICGKIKQLVHLGVYGSPQAEPAVGFVRWEERPRYRAPLRRAAATARPRSAQPQQEASL